MQRFSFGFLLGAAMWLLFGCAEVYAIVSGCGPCNIPQLCARVLLSLLEMVRARDGVLISIRRIFVSFARKFSQFCASVVLLLLLQIVLSRDRVCISFGLIFARVRYFSALCVYC